MRLRIAALLVLPVLAVACGMAAGVVVDGQESRPPAAVTPSSSQAPATSSPEIAPPPAPDMLALPAGGEPTAPEDPAALAVLLAEVERRLRDPNRMPESLVAEGRWQQVLYRKLGARPELLEPTVAAVPADLQPIVRANAFAGARLADMHKPKPQPPGSPPKELKLPSWRIVTPPPADQLLGFYREAEAATGVPWAYLAAVNLVETRMGRIRGTSVAGAQGPMQFMPATWGEWGEGGDVNDPRQAILGAARFLRWGGLPGDANKALFRYNRDIRYVDAVRTYAEQMLANPRAYYGYYHWQVYFGPVLLPEGYDGSTA